MAVHASTSIFDDIDGSLIAHDSGETVEFSVSGVDYIIDLTAIHAVEFIGASISTSGTPLARAGADGKH